MVNVNFIGRLGADAELKVNSNNGKEFLKMRVAHNEKYCGEEKTSWFSVSYDSGKASGMLPYLTKGKLIDIHGIERVSTYLDKHGETQIDRMVFADRIDFLPLSNKQESNPIAQSQVFTAADAAKVAISKESEKMAAMAAATVTANNVVLPF